jgi:hypothetical protein
MPLTPILTNENSVNRAKYIQLGLVDAVVRLLNNYQPQYTDNRSVLLSNEATFNGYPAGGYNSTNWAGPGLPPGGGAVLTSPTIMVVPVSGNNISNNITGYWVEAANLAGNLNATLLTAAINPGIPVYLPTDQFPLIIQDWEGLVASPG